MDSSEGRINTLITWALSHGAALHPSVEVYPDPATGLSFRVKPFASTPLTSNPPTPVVRLPTSLTLSYLNAITADSPGTPLSPAILSPPTATDTAAPLPPHVLGRLFLIKEYLAGPSSFWHAYIQALPQPGERASWLLPPFWDADDAELLEGTNVEHGLAKIQADIRGDLAAITAVLRRISPADLAGSDADGSNARLVDGFRPDLYRWAYATFSSRSFRPSLVLSEERCAAALPAGVSTDDFSALLPLFDVGNHDMTAPVRWERTKNNGGGDCCELHVGKEHQPGEQVFNNYSPKTNAELLLGYGFMLAPTATFHNDYIHLRKRGPSEDAATASEEYFLSARPMTDASSVLARAKLPSVAALAGSHIAPAFQHVQPDMAWDIFAALVPEDARRRLIPVQAASEVESESERRVQFLTGQVEGECLRFFAQTAAVLQHKVMMELERLDETDVEVGAEDAERLTPYQRLALEYRARCRVVLESTLEAMNNDPTMAAAMEAMDAE